MKKIMLVITFLFNAAASIICMLNVSANQFFLKSTNFYASIAFVSDRLEFISTWWCLLFPVWWRILWISGALPDLRMLLRLPHTWAFLALVCLSGIPFFNFNLAPPASSPGFLHLFFRDAFSQPLAVFFAAVSMSMLLGSVRIPPALIGAGAGVLRLLLSGRAIPRLEDETAYAVQSLLFQSGRLKGALFSSIGNLPGLAEARVLPFFIYADGGFFSAHMHGWSAVLAALAAPGLDRYSNFILFIVNIFLFMSLERKLFPENRLRLSVVFFVLSPLSVFLSTTLMAHTAASALGMLMIRLWLETGTAKSRMSAAVFSLLFLLAGLALAFVRLQSFIVFSASLGAFALGRLYLRAGPRGRIVYTGILLVSAMGATFLALRFYAGLYGSGHLVFMSDFMERYLVPGCQSLGFGPGKGCFPTYGTMGHSFRKFIFNFMDLLSRYNQELSPGSMPLFVIFLILAWRQRKTWLRGGELLAVMITLGGALLFGLYFHNGGESYRGRYASECSFAFFLALGRMAERELAGFDAAKIRSLSAAFALFVLPASLFFQSRGEYFHFQIRDADLRTWNRGISDSLVTVRPIRDIFIRRAGEEDVYSFPDEFQPGRMISLPASTVMHFMNLGYSSIAGSASRVDENGYLRDPRGNLLLGELPDASAEMLARSLRLRQICTLEFLPPSLPAGRAFLRVWKYEEPRLSCRPVGR